MKVARSVWVGLVLVGWASAAAGQTISSAANQFFVVSAPSTLMSTITINAGGVKIKKADDIRIMIPAGFNMTWDVSITTATITGSGAVDVSTTVTYEAASKTVVIDVLNNFFGTEQLVISGLRFMSFTAPSASSNLGLNVTGGVTVTASDNRTIAVVAPTFVGSANQSFTVGNAATAMTSTTITDNATSATITAANKIRIRIPSGFNMTWNTAITTATIGGAAAGKVSTTVSYENGGQVLVLNVTSNFAASDQITVSGLQFTNFTAVSAAANLQLVVSGSANGGTAATSDKTKQIVQPTISSTTNQTFVMAQPPTPSSTITITDAATATITAAGDIRIRIPASFNMTWNTAVVTATLGGGAAGKVAAVVSYEDAGKTLRLNVTINFAASDQITVSGLQFANFTAASAADYLQLVVSGAGGGTAARDPRTITIVGAGVTVSPPTMTASALPSNGTSYTAVFTVQNTGIIVDGYDLLVSRRPGTTLSTVSITGTAVTQAGNPDSARLGTLAAGGSVAVTVTYSVGNVAAGAIDTLIFTARSILLPAGSSNGRLTLTVVRPNLTIAKAVSPTGTWPPGTDLLYTVTLTNPGSAPAASIVTVDTLRSTVTFKVGSVVNTLPGGLTATLAYSNDGGSTWTYVPASQACGAPAGFDRCVNRVRWTFTGSLSSTAPNNVAVVEFISRIR
ncbi:MAG: hypothetical protein ABI703_03805 [Gemmatimonadales bacterium]